MSHRAVRKVRRLLGRRLRTLRSERGLSQKMLGRRSGLSGKFIGEVERGLKSISLDSLYRVSIALGIPIAFLTDVRDLIPSDEGERILAIVSQLVRPEDVHAATQVLSVLLGGGG